LPTDRINKAGSRKSLLGFVFEKEKRLLLSLLYKYQAAADQFFCIFPIQITYEKISATPPNFLYPL
jgi:hypothetical protein